MHTLFQWWNKRTSLLDSFLINSFSSLQTSTYISFAQFSFGLITPHRLINNNFTIIKHVKPMTIEHLVLCINFKYFIFMFFPKQFSLAIVVKIRLLLLIRMKIMFEFLETCEILVLLPQRVEVIALFMRFVLFCDFIRWSFFLLTFV